MQYTENLRLKKPEGTDFYNIDDFNENADKIEAKILEVQSRTDASINTLSANKANKTDVVNHTNNKNNPHGVTKEQVGLGNVDNTSDADKPISKATQEALDDVESKSIITDTATGETITVTNSADAPVRSFKVDGKTEQEGEPTPDNPKDIICVGESGNVEVTVTGKNLFGGLALANKLVEVASAVLDKSNGTVTHNAWDSHRVSLYTGFKKDTQYTIILCGTGAVINLSVLYTDGTYANLGDLVDGKKVFISETGKTVQNFCTYWYDGSTTLYYDKCGIFEGVVSFEDFEEYKSQTISIPLTSPLFEGDNVTLKNGKLEIYRKFKIVDFPNIDSFGTYGDGRKYSIFSQSDMSDYGTSKCTHMKEIQPSDNVTYGFMVNQYNSVFMFSSDDTVETANAKMAGAKVLYLLKEPTTEIIDTDIDLSTYCNVTHISNADNANMEVEYFVNSPNGNVAGDLQEQVNNTVSYLNDYIVVEEFQVSSNEYTIPHNERWEFELIVNKSGYIPLMATFDNADLTNISYAKCAVFKRDVDYKVSCDVYNNENSNVSVRGTIRVLYVKA